MSFLIPEDASQIAETIFTCAVCGRVATHLELFVASGSDRITSGESGGFLRASEFLGETEMVVSAGEIGRLQTLIEQKRAREMHEIYLKYAPCFCLQCQKHYCEIHWTTSIVFDDGYYDCTDGVCPEGHEQMVDD